LGFGVWTLGFGAWGLGFEVWGLGFRVWSFRWRVLIPRADELNYGGLAGESPVLLASEAGRA